jgi:murein L,D-transpeptidase YafK
VPLLLAFLLTGTAAAADPCVGRGTSIVVEVGRERLWLCEKNRAVHDYPVALGSGGSGKSAQGDKKTPLGTYALAQPRPSKEFGTFIPIGYPTEEQRRHGATGGDVGIHGPKRSFAWAGPANTWVDWTRGCVAVATDEAIGEIAAWVRRERPASVHLVD